VVVLFLVGWDLAYVFLESSNSLYEVSGHDCPTWSDQFSNRFFFDVLFVVFNTIHVHNLLILRNVDRSFIAVQAGGDGAVANRPPFFMAGNVNVDVEESFY
jgi:hypothetical protein